MIGKKPLILEPVLVEIQLRLDAQDLAASLDSPLLQSGLDDLWQMILAPQQMGNCSLELSDLAVEWCSMAIANQGLNLTGRYQDASGETRELCLSTGVSLADSHTLCLSPLEINYKNHKSVANELKIDLGIDVEIAQLIIESEQIICSGVIRINY